MMMYPRIDLDMFEQQPTITIRTRVDMVRWFAHCYVVFKAADPKEPEGACWPDVVFTAASLLDQFCNVNAVKNLDDYHYLGLTCFWMAFKYHQDVIYDNMLEQLIRGNSRHPDEAMDKELLKGIKQRIRVIEAHVMRHVEWHLGFRTLLDLYYEQHPEIRVEPPLVVSALIQLIIDPQVHRYDPVEVVRCVERVVGETSLGLEAECEGSPCYKWVLDTVFQLPLTRELISILKHDLEIRYPEREDPASPRSVEGVAYKEGGDVSIAGPSMVLG